jgi:hypothetical protein
MTGIRETPAMPILLLLVVAVLMLSGVAHAAPEAKCSDAPVFFCDNFEDRATGSGDLQNSKGGKTLGWLLSDFSTMTVATDQSFTGTKSIKHSYPACSWDTNQSDLCGAGFMTMLSAYNKNELYARMYSKWGSGAGTWKWSANGTKHFNLATNGGADRQPWFNTVPSYPSGSGVHHVKNEPDGDQPYAQNQGNNATFLENQWYCIEIHVVRNSGTGDGVVETWVDDVLRMRHTNVNWGTHNWDDAMLSGYWNSFQCLASQGCTQAECEGYDSAYTPSWNGTKCSFSRVAQAKWYDNVIFSTARIGCIGGALTPPATPTGLTITLLLSVVVGAIVVTYPRRARGV